MGILACIVFAGFTWGIMACTTRFTLGNLACIVLANCTWGITDYTTNFTLENHDLYHHTKPWGSWDHWLYYHFHLDNCGLYHWSLLWDLWPVFLSFKLNQNGVVQTLHFTLRNVVYTTSFNQEIYCIPSVLHWRGLGPQVPNPDPGVPPSWIFLYFFLLYLEESKPVQPDLEPKSLYHF